ncbi:MAG: hypothetical protein BM563_04825 [Bacteroidetes bacterium MedPE-SWsnd-G1]|nr:MAG: hypothetical protein BM563_04825 [Bacteroidetes bacterium MedPE-SWsnd-G1]
MQNLKKVNNLILLSLFISTTYTIAQNDSIQKHRKDKAGYTIDLENGITSLISFAVWEDDLESATFLRFSKLDSITKPWFGFKRKLNEKTGLQISTSYSSTNMYGQNGPDKLSEFSGSNIFKIYTRWKLINRDEKNSGTLVVNTDYRHSYTPITPNNLGFELGYNGMPALLFSDAKIMLLELTWQQLLNKGRTGFIIGRYDPNDYLDVLGYVNPFTTFQNLSILVNASIGFADSSTGIGFGHWINDQFAISATVNDANGIGTEVQFFEDFNELYTSVEVSWSPSRSDRFLKNFHITYWHVDERDKLDIEESQGIALGFNWTYNEVFMPFVKVGWSNGDASIYTQSYTAGFILRPNLNKDLIGFGLNWGDTQSGIGQLSTELFYRFQISQNFAVTPSAQYYNNPALNTDLDNMFVFGLRGRITL